MTQAFDGIRILDFTQLEQGPCGTQVLADFGADVIKIERINTGEIGRGQWPVMANNYSPHWSATNRNKRSLSLDVKSERGRTIVLELVKTADIVASNFRPGVMERLGFGYGELSALNPRIIVAYASGYGQSGPYVDHRGQDLAAQAMGGLMALTGSAEGAPTPSGTFMIDFVASMQFALGMMIALAARERTGRGQIVDSCLLNAAITTHLQEGTAFLNTGESYSRPPAGIAHHHNTALYGYYETADGRWLALIGEFYVDEPWQRVGRALGLDPRIIEDPRLQTRDGLLEHVEETRDLVALALRGLTLDDALKRLRAEDVLVAPVNGYKEVFSDPQVVANEMVISAHLDEIGEVRFVGMPVKLSETPASVRFPPPSVGEHNEELLAELGCSPEEIRDIKRLGIVGSENEKASGGTGRWW